MEAVWWRRGGDVEEASRRCGGSVEAASGWRQGVGVEV